MNVFYTKMEKKLTNFLNVERKIVHFLSEILNNVILLLLKKIASFEILFINIEAQMSSEIR